MPKIKNKDLIQMQPYTSIMGTLELCKIFHPNYNGLTHAHFLYFLLDKKNLNLYMKPEKQEEMKKYFKQIKGKQYIDKKSKKVKKLPIWIPYKIKKGCIKNPQRLNEKLTVLMEREWIEPKGEPKYRTYYMTDKFKTIMHKVSVQGLLELYPNERLEDLIDYMIKIINEKN